MLRTRVIPILLMKQGGLYKGIKFKNHKYVGDPINTLKIFNEKEVDELVLLDIEASALNKTINFELIKDIVSEAFMPIAYGGGIKSIDDAKRLFNVGIEKIILNTHALENHKLVSELVEMFGAQSIVFCLDIKKNFFGKYSVFSKSGTYKINKTPLDIALIMQELGVGEIVINSIDNDGTMQGYDLEIIELLSKRLHIPLVALGGAKNLHDFQAAVKHGAHAVAAGSMFIFHGPHRAVLLSYPKHEELSNILKEN